MIYLTFRVFKGAPTSAVPALESPLLAANTDKVILGGFMEENASNDEGKDPPVST